MGWITTPIYFMKTLNIVIPTINRKDLLMEALVPINKQLDQFDKLLIIDNGNQDIENSIKDLDLVKQNKVEIYIPGNNIGVGPSWNYGISKSLDKDFILFLNDDIVISDTQLKDIHTNVLDNRIFWLATGGYHWCMFLFAREAWEFFLKQDGFVFDPSFYPAYFEDNDMCRRVHMADINMHIGVKEMDPLVFRNSMTIAKDPKINSGFGKNQQYYVRKWGGMPSHEKFATPFNR
jgi:glycosyltransferase involved in cell wall biosynthesis